MRVRIFCDVFQVMPVTGSLNSANAARYKIMKHTYNLYVFTFLTITEIVIRNLSEISQIAQWTRSKRMHRLL